MAARASARVQVSGTRVQVQPVPLIAVAVSPLGRVSTTVTAAVVGPWPTLETVSVYVAPVWPTEKFPVWLLLIAKSGVMFTLMVAVPVKPAEWVSVTVSVSREKSVIGRQKGLGIRTREMDCPGIAAQRKRRNTALDRQSAIKGQ